MNKPEYAQLYHNNQLDHETTPPLSILYSFIARGTSVLVRQSACVGNFVAVTDQLISKIPTEDTVMTYTSGSYLFHFITENRVIFMCITEDSFARSKAFAFLHEIKRRFMNQYGERVYTALPYAMNSDFAPMLHAQMKHYSKMPASSASNGPGSGAQSSAQMQNGGGSTKINKVQGQVDELKDIMVKNIDQIAARGERLELLVDRTEDLQANAVSFKRTSRNLERSMWLKNMKLTIIIAVVAIVIVYFIVCACCGGLDWNTCV